MLVPSPLKIANPCCLSDQGTRMLPHCMYIKNSREVLENE